MFKKALKYDMASIKRYWWMIAVALLGLSVVGSLVFRFVYYYTEISGPDDSVFLSLTYIAAMIFLFVCVIAAFSSVYITPIMTHLRYYRNFFTDEGYLTFTLPVRRKTLYLAKTVNSMIWAFAHVLVMFVAAAIVLTLAPVPEQGQLLNFVVWQSLGEAISAIWEACGAWLFVYVLELLLIYFCASAMSVGLVQLCVTIGSIVAKKQKLLASIGIYYAFNMGVTTVSQVVLSICSIFMSSGIIILVQRASANVGYFSLSLALLLCALAFAAFAMIVNFIALGLVERKLNLA